MRLVVSFFLIVSMVINVNSQSKLPYYEVPDASKEFTAGAVASRTIDGLGFRYYWATEGLLEKDLAFKPNKAARTTAETIDHILDLSQVIINAVFNKPNGAKQPKMTFTEKRKKTLENLKQASDVLRVSNDLSQYKIIFGEKKFPFWNALNGPILDATWHVGQIVSFRRSSGNPFPKGVSFLTGTVKK
ncbi:hypothetical protein [Tenacibaculum insulae]|uniref:hypothetical protein n=1 Tax=Tenacibaculum insulae TaxID=2029677 RepID=UPI003AB23335